MVAAVLAPILRADAQGASKPLTELAGRTIPGLETIGLTNFQIGTDYFSGTASGITIPGATGDIRIAGFKADGAKEFAIVISLPRFSLAQLMPELNGTGLEHLAFSGARFVIAPSGAKGASVKPPSKVSDITGASLVLPAVPGLQGSVDLGGPFADWFNTIGMPTTGLPIGGGLPVGVFTGKIPAGQIASALYPLLDLTLTAPAGMLAAAAPPLPAAKLTALSLKVDGKSGSPAFTLSGALALSGNRTVRLTASGGGPKPAVLSLEAKNLNVGDLVGLSVPGLNALALTGITLAADGVAADLMIGTIPTHASAFKVGSNRAVALTADSIRFRDLVSAVTGTPLDDLRITRPTFIYVQSAASGIQIPASQRARFTNVPSKVDAGLSLAGQFGAVGEVGKLLSAVGVPSGGSFPSVSTLDPSFLARPVSIPDFDIAIPVGALGQLLPPSVATMGNGSLRLVHKGSTTNSFAVEADGKVVINGQDVKLSFAMSAGKENGASFTAVKGSTSLVWAQPFGVDWLTVGNVSLAARVGNSGSFSISGVTDLGRIKGLKVATSATYDATGITSASLALTGAEIPLAEVPVLNTLPGADQFVLRNLVISNNAIAGDARLKAKQNWLETVIFKSPLPTPGWNVAVLYSDIGVTDFFPDMPKISRELLGQVRLSRAAMLVSQAGITGDVGRLPAPAQAKLHELFGADVRTLSVVSGIGLVASMDPKANPAIGSLLTSTGSGNGPLAISGSVSGLFGGPPAFDLAANLPTVKLPSTYSFLALPTRFTAGFHVKVDPTAGPSLGVQIDALFPVPATGGKKGTSVDGTLALALTATGGVTGSMSATTMEPWPNALGINGFTLEPQSLFGLSVSATSEVDVRITGNTKIGTREVKVAGRAGIVGGVLAKGALGGYASELGMADVMALTNAIVSAGGGAPLQTSFPAAKLDSAALGFASPGESLPEFGIIGGGVHVGGRLWLIFPDGPLGRIDGTMDVTGVVASGKLHDFTVGPLAMKGNDFDLLAKVDPLRPPHLLVRGSGSLEGASTAFEMAAVGTRVTFRTVGEFKGANFSYDFGAYFEGPAQLTAKQLEGIDLGLDATLNIGHLQRYMTDAGTAAARKALNGVGGDLKAATDSLNKAKKAVASLNDSVTKYIARVRSERLTVDQMLSAANKSVSDADARVNRLSKDISACKGKIKTCNQTRRICLWYDVIAEKCTDYREVPDLIARARCEVRNADYAIDLAALRVEKEVANAGLAAANRTLSLLNSGVDSIPAELDPRVAPYVVARDAANAALALAQSTVDGMADATASAERAVTALQAGSNAIQIKKAHIQGSVQQLVKQKPVLLDVTFAVGPRTMTSRLPFAPTNLTYSTTAFELVALEALYAATLADPKASSAVQSAARTAYLDKRDVMDSIVEAITSRNAVRPVTGTSARAQVLPPVDDSGDPTSLESQRLARRTVTIQRILDATDSLSRGQALARIDSQVAVLMRRSVMLTAKLRPSAPTRPGAPPPTRDTDAATRAELSKVQGLITALGVARDSVKNRSYRDTTSAVPELQSEAPSIGAGLGEREVPARPREREAARRLDHELKPRVDVDPRVDDHLWRVDLDVVAELRRQPDRSLRH